MIKPKEIAKYLIIIGWISFLLYNFITWKFLVQEYEDNPANFVFLADEQQRIEYKQNSLFIVSDHWTDKASLMSECKPAVYLNNFYFTRLDLFIKLSLLLLFLTIIYKVPTDEWGKMVYDIQTLCGKLEDEKDDKKDKEDIKDDEEKKMS